MKPKTPEGSLIAIDPSINNIGYAIWRDGNCIHSGTIHTKGETDVEKLESLWPPFAYLKVNDLKTLVIETPDGWTRNGTNVRSLMKLCKAIGYIEGYLVALEIIEVPVSEWKGRQPAAEIIMAAKALTGKAKISEHEAHAVCLGYWYIAKEKP